MNVELVRWDDEYSNGIAEVDAQHRNLFTLINRTYRAVVERAHSTEVQEIIRALEDYTIGHFADEERYMATARYPRLGEHRLMHAGFVARVAQEREKLRAGFPLDLSIVHFLRDWLLDHILKQDKDFGRFERGIDARTRASRQRIFGNGLGGFIAELLGGVQDPPAKSAAPARVRGGVRAQPVGLATTIEFHMRWKRQFEAALANADGTTLDPAQVRRDEASALGQWLYGEGRQRFGRAPELDEVLMWHAELHRQAADIAALAQADAGTDVRAHLKRGPYVTAAMRLRTALSKMFATEAANPGGAR